MCLRDQGWQGSLFIRQLYLLLCRRDTEGSSTSAMQKVHADIQLLWTPKAALLGGKGGPIPIPGNWNLSTVYTSPLQPSLPLPREEQGVLIISVVQM